VKEDFGMVIEPARGKPLQRFAAQHNALESGTHAFDA
jgi:hypothetical protein